MQKSKHFNIPVCFIKKDIKYYMKKKQQKNGEWRERREEGE